MADNTDLIKAYEFIVGKDQFLPSDLADEFGHNMRYSREIIGVLMSKKLATLNTSTDLDYYEPVLPKGMASPREFGLKRLGLKEDAVRQPKAGKSATSSRPKVDHGEYHPCGCGCGEMVPPKSNYRPGHDARHAGQIGREIAANYAVKGFDRRELLAKLPSDALKAKAEKIAETTIAKAERKGRKDVEPVDVAEEGLIKIGKTEYPATRSLTTGEVTRVDGKPVSKTAAKTFEVA